MEEDTQPSLGPSADRHKTVIADWALFKSCSIHQTSVCRTNLWLINKLSQPDCRKFFPTLSVTCAILNRRPYYRSAANLRLRNKPKPLAELKLFPLGAAQAHWRPMLEAGIKESGFCASTMPVCEAGDWAKPKSDPKRRMLCTLEYFSQTNV